MEKYALQITPEAESDIDVAYEYISDHLANHQAAFDLCEAIWDAIEGLSSLPLRFPVWRNEPWKSQGVRSMPVKNYLVFYHVNELLHRVTILRVFYNRRNT